MANKLGESMQLRCDVVPRVLVVDMGRFKFSNLYHAFQVFKYIFCMKNNCNDQKGDSIA